MKSVINELYNGEIFPVETETLKDEKYRRTVNKVGREIEEFEELLTKEQYAKLEHMMDMNAEIFNMENRAVFADLAVGAANQFSKWLLVKFAGIQVRRELFGVHQHFQKTHLLSMKQS